MPSAANGKSEKAASSEATETPIRQIVTVIEHKIRNLEKRKSKLTSYRDLQKSGKDLNADQKIAVAKYDEVAQTLEFARDLSKQVTSIVVSADRDAKKQAKKDAWFRAATETNKIREVLLILDCLVQMGSSEARDDFLRGNNGAVKLAEEDLKILDDLYPEVTPKHEVNEEGLPGFHGHSTRAAEHLNAIIDGKPKDVFGTTYAHIKEIISMVHECGYFDKTMENIETNVQNLHITENMDNFQEPIEEVEQDVVSLVPMYAGAPSLPVPPAPAVVPAPAYPLCPIPPITLQEVEHAYFSQQYPQQRPISEVIGSQNFFFLQESEIDSPVGTPQPPPLLNQVSPPAPIPTQTFTNQHFVMSPRVPPDPTALPIPQPHFVPTPDHPAFTGVNLPSHAVLPPPMERHITQQPPLQMTPPMATQQHPYLEQPLPVEEQSKAEIPNLDQADEWKESPEIEETNDRARGQGQGDGRNRRYGRNVRGTSNGYRGRGGFQNKTNNDAYHNRHDYRQKDGYQKEGYQKDGYQKDGYQKDGYQKDGYQKDGYHKDSYQKDGYQSRQYNNDGYSRGSKDGYQNRNTDSYYGNGDNGNGHHNENNGTRDRYDNNQNYQGGFKGRGRGAPRGVPRGSRAPRPQHYNRKPDNVD